MSETKKNSVFTLKKIALISVISLLLIIPLTMISGVIDEREYSRKEVKEQISKSVADDQVIDGIRLVYTVEEERMVDSKKEIVEDVHIVYPKKLESDVSVSTETLKRSIYNVIIYHSIVNIKGSFLLPDAIYEGKNIKVKMKVSDLKGLMDNPQISLMEKNYQFDVDDSGFLYANIELPAQKQFDGVVLFSMNLNMKGTERLMFAPNADETIVTINSPYPNPSFVGEYLPLSRDVNGNGFTATWKILKINKKANTYFGVDFIEMASQYQQAMRSVKYGMLIICLVFVAGLLVEFVAKKQIHVMQYAVIGISLVLFYSLLIAFSDIVMFGMAYLISATMTTFALTLYYRGILKSNSAWVLGGFVSLMYMANYILLQMETYSLLAGSLLLFALLCVVMYFTTDMNKKE